MFTWGTNKKSWCWPFFSLFHADVLKILTPSPKYEKKTTTRRGAANPPSLHLNSPESLKFIKSKDKDFTEGETSTREDRRVLREVEKEEREGKWARQKNVEKLRVSLFYKKGKWVDCKKLSAAFGLLVRVTFFTFCDCFQTWISQMPNATSVFLWFFLWKHNNLRSTYPVFLSSESTLFKEMISFIIV